MDYSGVASYDNLTTWIQPYALSEKSRVKWLVIGFLVHLQLGITKNCNTAQLTITHTSLLSLLQPPLVGAWLQSSNSDYS
jgi:hypothetical protein